MTASAPRRLFWTWLISIAACLLIVVVLAVLRTPANQAYLTGHADHTRVTVTATARVPHNCAGGFGTKVSVSRAASSSQQAWSAQTVTCAKAPRTGASVDVWRFDDSRFTLINPAPTVILALLMLVVITGAGLWGLRRVRRIT